MSLTRFLRHGARSQVNPYGGFGRPTLLGKGGRREYVPSIGSGLLLNMPLRKDTRMIYSAGGADGFSPPPTVDEDGTYKARTALGGLITRATTNTARIEDDGVLVEGARTNICIRSEEIDNASWTKSGITVTADQIAAPDGNVTADLLTKDDDVGSRYVRQARNATVARYTLSCWLKAGTFDTVAIGIHDGAGWEVVVPSIISGPGAVADTGLVTVSGLSTTEWTRVSLVTANNLAVAAHNCYFYPGGTASGNAGKTIYLWGVQFEAGTSASSYIPTTTASVERAADNLQIDNTSEVHCKKGAGTIILAVTPSFTAAPPSNACAFSCYTATPSGNGLILYPGLTTNGGKPVLYVYTDAGIVAQLTSTDAVSSGTTIILAITWDTDDFRLYVNGADEQSDTAGATPTVIASTIFVGQNHLGAEQVLSNIAHLWIYNRALVAADIATLSAEMTEMMA